jgi:hypothetical protein
VSAVKPVAMLDLLFGSDLPTLSWLSVSRCSEVGFGFPIRCDHARSRRFLRPSALCPSATDPTPLALLLKTKVKPKFDRAVTDRSKPFFSVFHVYNSSQFQLLFSSFTVRSAEGYKPFQLPCGTRS